MTLYDDMQSDRVSELALRPPIRSKSTDTVRDAILRMRAGKLGCTIVVDDDDKPVGIFTEAILRRQLSHSREVLDHELKSHMATTFAWVSNSDPVETVLDAMELKNIRFVVVVNDDGTVAGVTGQKSLMEYVADSFPGDVMVQRVGGQPYPETREGA
jgi:arabinose-5-phosphate isomerase